MKKAVAFQDEVKHKTGIIGIVTAIYMRDDRTMLDVREGDIMHFGTPAANWEVIRTQEENEGTTD